MKPHFLVRHNPQERNTVALERHAVRGITDDEVTFNKLRDPAESAVEGEIADELLHYF